MELIYLNVLQFNFIQFMVFLDVAYSIQLIQQASVYALLGPPGPGHSGISVSSQAGCWGSMALNVSYIVIALCSKL